MVSYCSSAFDWLRKTAKKSVTLRKFRSQKKIVRKANKVLHIPDVKGIFGYLRRVPILIHGTAAIK